MRKWLPHKPEQWFVCIALICGGFFALFTPPYLGGDEIYHFTRAFQVAEGGLIPQKTQYGTGGEVPSSIFTSYKYINENHKRLSNIKAAINQYPLKPAERMFVSFPHTAVNNPLMYLPQALAIRTGLTFEAPPALLMYMARLGNLIFYVLAMYLAIRLLPYGKYAFMAITLMPANIVAASSGSADTLTIVGLGLFMAAILHLRARQRPLKIWGILAFFGLVLAMSLTKLPVPIFLLLTFFIPPRVLGGRLRWMITLAGAALLALIVGGGWIVIFTATLTPYGPAGVNLTDQLFFMFNNPLHFLYATFTTYFSDASNGMASAYALALTPQGAVLPLWATVIYAVCLSRFFPVKAGPHVWKLWQKWLVVGLMASFLIGVAALLYLSWTPVGGAIVEGIHPRYLTPLLFLCIPVFATMHGLPAATRFGRWWRICMPIAFLLLASFILIRGFYL